MLKTRFSRRKPGVILLAACFHFTGCHKKPATVRVAAVQFHSFFGDPEANRKRLLLLVRLAAYRGARIVVLPEAAVPGYAELSNEVFWSRKREKGYEDVRTVAEKVPGPSVEFFSPVADELDIFLTVPLIEESEGKFYNTVVLLGPDGRVRAKHRKQNCWPVADASWMTEGEEEPCVVETEFGRLGLMICYDVHVMLEALAEAGADAILYSVAWYGTCDWFETVLARRAGEAGVSIVLANWTFPEDPGWKGSGRSLVIGPDGGIVARAAEDFGEEIVLADIPVGQSSD